MDGLANRVEHLCTLLGQGDDLPSYAEEAGAGGILSRVLAALGRSGKAVGPETDLETDLDALDEAMARFGFGPVTRATRVFRPVPGVGAGHPVVQAWTCPLARPCSRVEPAARTADPPVCGVVGAAMTLVRLPT